LAENIDLNKEINEAEVQRLDNIEERTQIMLEYLISKGTCSFLEQSEGN
jgi:hypothetical protein